MSSDLSEGGLPSFTSPPVVEVVVGIQFAQLPLRAIDLGPLGELWRADYPQLAEQPPLEPVPVVDEPPRPLIVIGPPRMPRHVWQSGDESRLLQLQQDRLVVNWRRPAPADSYPRFPSLREELVGRLDELTAFVKPWGALRPTAAEVIYVNDLGSGAAAAPSLAEALTPVVAADLPGELVEERYAAAYRLQDVPDADAAAAPSGRGLTQLEVMPSAAQLVVTADPAVQLTGARTTLLTLTVRAGVPAGTMPAVMALVDWGHERIVRCFTALTTPSMHERWGRE